MSVDVTLVVRNIGDITEVPLVSSVGFTVVFISGEDQALIDVIKFSINGTSEVYDVGEEVSLWLVSNGGTDGETWLSARIG